MQSIQREEDSESKEDRVRGRQRVRKIEKQTVRQTNRLQTERERKSIEREEDSEGEEDRE